MKPVIPGTPASFGAKRHCSLPLLMKCEVFLSVMINKQNSEWNSRRFVLLERRDREIHRQLQKDDEDAAKQHSESSCPLCTLLHSLLAESREEWREALSLRVNELKREVRYSAGAALPARRDGNEGDDVEWSVAQLYKTFGDWSQQHGHGGITDLALIWR
ncbi:hypothetical protein C3747_204g48 [Trypanosoma cruzi]|uniref:Uncharacterized protein n=1 Tax=Trypanosoma cruzi TaxID=5693 RepID=A0A2V2VWY3_TRYCR|nr:hypothetical protein C3747_204g48 [Trypanosoma cruzi]